MARINKYKSDRFIQAVVNFVGLCLILGCTLRKEASETKVAGGSMCEYLVQFIQQTLKNCSLGNGDLSICEGIKRLPLDNQCIIFNEVFKDIEIPSKRAQFLGALPDNVRSELGKELEFLIPDDVKPRLKPSSYVDAYVKAVKRLSRFDIPTILASVEQGDADTLSRIGYSEGSPNKILNSTYDQIIGLDENNIVFTKGKNLMIFDTKTRNVNTVDIGSKSDGLFKWRNYICTIQASQINCYMKSELTKCGSTLRPNVKLSLPNHRRWESDLFIQVINDNVYVHTRAC